MVVPAVGVVVHDDHGGAVPCGPGFQKIDRIHKERLLIQWVGISGMAVLVSLRLQKADGREIALAAARKNPGYRTGDLPDQRCQFQRAKLAEYAYRLRGRGVIIKERVVRNVVGRRSRQALSSFWRIL